MVPETNIKQSSGPSKTREISQRSSGVATDAGDIATTLSPLCIDSAGAECNSTIVSRPEPTPQCELQEEAEEIEDEKRTRIWRQQPGPSAGTVTSYGTWAIPQLRAECRKRGMKVTVGSLWLTKPALVRALVENDGRTTWHIISLRAQ